VAGLFAVVLVHHHPGMPDRFHGCRNSGWRRKYLAGVLTGAAEACRNDGLVVFRRPASMIDFHLFQIVGR